VDIERWPGWRIPIPRLTAALFVAFVALAVFPSGSADASTI